MSVAAQPESRAASQEKADRPAISVVIASVNGEKHLEGCLAALVEQTVAGKMEVVVADRCGDAVTQLVRGRYPRVRLLSLGGDKSIPELRSRGIQASRGDVIAITEDHCIAPPDWCAGILRAHEERNGIIGGAVENHPEMNSVLDWATYLCEYAAFMNPVPDGEAERIPGNNISYRRAMLDEVRDLLVRGAFWEDALNQRLRARGFRTYSDPRIVITHKKSFRMGEFLSQRYHYSRSYAGLRVRNEPFWKKLVCAGFCPLLPALVMGRIGYNVLAKRRFAGKFFAAFPVLVIFSLAWAWGELVGYLWGAGESLRKVE